MATEVKIKELSMNDLVLGENSQVQKVSLKSETMREKLCSIFKTIEHNYMSPMHIPKSYKMQPFNLNKLREYTLLTQLTFSEKMLWCQAILIVYHFHHFMSQFMIQH